MTDAAEMRLAAREGIATDTVERMDSAPEEATVATAGAIDAVVVIAETERPFVC